ncbi:MAG: ATP-binding cassette domain-containing protein [Cyanobacteria bacterium NC_groundwater_1444_Ag_S-0.65um_54_12]|nr:ATP-binding cassette domain-containing protein [Cyanobacteria bacterium NC_groundwater_1444_Ag_S-0.65um_54_12]
MEEKAIIQASNLRKHYGSFVAVRGIDFTVNAGHCFGFLGPNGAGKTTTMRLLTVQIPPSAGYLRVLGMDTYQHARRIKARLGVVPQDNNLDPDFTAIENLLVYASYFSIPRREALQRARQLLAFVALEDKADVVVDKLSGGMRRRLVIARALLNNPDLLVLDEPTTGLDPQARHLLWQKLRQLRNEGVTMVLSTHYMEEAAQLCDELVVMDQGTILANGTPTELVKQHSSPTVLELRIDRADPADWLTAVSHRVNRLERVGDMLYLYSSDGEELLCELRHHALSALLRPASLEDVFLILTGRNLKDPLTITTPSRSLGS